MEPLLHSCVYFCITRCNTTPMRATNVLDTTDQEGAQNVRDDSRPLSGPHVRPGPRCHEVAPGLGRRGRSVLPPRRARAGVAPAGLRPVATRAQPAAARP